MPNPLPIATWLKSAILAAGVPITDVQIVDVDKSTWRVRPSTLQGAAQPIIDAFHPDDPAHLAAELDAQVTTALDTERLASAIVWTILKQMFPADTDAQLRTKCGVARTRIVDAFKSRPWRPVP